MRVVVGSSDFDGHWASIQSSVSHGSDWQWGEKKGPVFNVSANDVAWELPLRLVRFPVLVPVCTSAYLEIGKLSSRGSSFFLGVGLRLRLNRAAVFELGLHVSQPCDIE